MPNNSDKSNAEVARHPLAIAWDEWLASDEGSHCAQPNYALARPSVYLENRLHRAFDAGATRAQSQLAEKVMAEIENTQADEFTGCGIEKRLRDLFKRMGIEVES